MPKWVERAKVAIESENRHWESRLPAHRARAASVLDELEELLNQVAVAIDRPLDFSIVTLKKLERLHHQIVCKRVPADRSVFEMLLALYFGQLLVTSAKGTWTIVIDPRRSLPPSMGVRVGKATYATNSIVEGIYRKGPTSRAKYQLSRIATLHTK